MNIKSTCFTGTLILLAGAQPALANQPPGAHVLLAEVLILPVMALFSLMGGAYVIINRKQKRKRILPTVIVATLAIIVSGMHEGIGVLVALIFGIFALIRAFQMLFWGIDAFSRQKTSPDLAGVNPRRLIMASMSLFVVTVFLSGMAVAFVGFWPRYYQEQREEGLKDIVTHHIAYAGLEAERTGETAFHPLPVDIMDSWKYTIPVPDVKIEFSQDHQSFAVYLLPKQLPFFPFNYLTSQPSYRGDQTGRIRMIRVNRKDHLCPDDAPVVMRVGTAEIEKVMKDLRKGSEN